MCQGRNFRSSHESNGFISAGYYKGGKYIESTDHAMVLCYLLLVEHSEFDASALQE